MKTTIVKYAFAGLCLLLPFANAQSVLGTVEGRVTDQSGKALPGASVTLTAEETGSKHTTKSDTAGEYRIAQLPAGEYRLEVQSASFRAEARRVILQVDQDARIDVALRVTGEKVEVTAPITPLRAESGAVTSVLDNRSITGLPLDGRNFYELTLLLPGVVPAAQGSAGSVRGDFAVNVNGAREDANYFLLDGVYNNDPKLNGVGADTPVDSIREFEVLTSSYDASFGRNGGAQINVITRSGGNHWHGVAYEFFRNAALDGRNFFAPAGTAPKNDRNQFGASIGGPIKKDRTFIFLDYEGRIWRDGITQVTNVPTLAERQGDFSKSYGPPVNPFTGMPFPGNILPSYYQNPVGAAIAALFPLPNRNVPGANYVSSPTEPDNSHHFDVRLDHMYGAATNLSFRYSYANRDFLEPFSSSGGAQVPGYGNDVPRLAQNAALSLVHPFSPALLSETRFGFSRTAINVTQQFAGTDLNGKVGLPEVSSNPRDFGLSQINVTGFSTLGPDLDSPQHGVTNDVQGLEQITWTSGRHLIKFGGDYRSLQQNAFRDVESRGFIDFEGVITGNPIADLLLGLPTVSGAAKLNNPEYLRSHSFDMFVQDNFRVRSNLMINIGVRYEYNSPGVDKYNHANIFNQATNSLVQVGTNGVPRSGYSPDRTNFAPRIGLAWSKGQFVVRAGYGVYFDQASLAPGEGLYFSPPYFNSNLYYSYPGVYTLMVNNPFPSNFPLPTPPTALAYQKDLSTPYIQQWNVAVQRQFGRSSIAEIGYVGSKGTHLLDGRDINQAPPSTNPYYQRPLPQFADIDLEESGANSSYNSMQARFQQRLAHGVTAMASYTWSKSLDDASGFFSTLGDPNFPQNSYNLRAERGRSDFDVAQRLAVSYTCDLPQGHNILLKGWQTAGIWTFQSGQPFTVSLLSYVDNANTGIDTLGFGANDRPNRLSSGTISNPGPNEWFNTAAFVTAAYGHFGNSGRNILSGPGLESFNVSLLKNTSLKEYGTVQFRAEFFNALNTANFSLPNNFVGSPQFGTITSSGDPRRIQFGLKWLF